MKYDFFSYKKERVMIVWEVVAFIAYFVVVLAIGVYFYFKGKKKVEGEKDYFLGLFLINTLLISL